MQLVFEESVIGAINEHLDELQEMAQCTGNYSMLQKIYRIRQLLMSGSITEVYSGK